MVSFCKIIRDELRDQSDIDNNNIIPIRELHTTRDMSFGISLSQLISSNITPIKSGIDELDLCLEDGFQSRSIYEIYGPPGVGKTKLGLQITTNFIRDESNASDKLLWIETYKSIPLQTITDKTVIESERIFNVQLTKITELIIFFNKLVTQNDSIVYKLIIIDGFSSIINDHLNNILKRTGSKNNEINMHDLKCKHLILLFTIMTKYIHANGSTIIILNKCMNTAFNTEFNINASVEDNLTVIEDGSNFFVKTIGSGSGISTNGENIGMRKNIQILKSELVSNVGVGTRDSRWEVFIKNRIGLFWEWENKLNYINKNSRSRFKRCRIAVVFNTEEYSINKDNDNNNSNNYLDRNTSFGSSTANSQNTHRSATYVKIHCNEEGDFASLKTLSQIAGQKRSSSPIDSDFSIKKKQVFYANGRSTPDTEFTPEVMETSTQSLPVSSVERDQSIILSDIIKNNDKDVDNDEIIYDSEG